MSEDAKVDFVKKIIFFEHWNKKKLKNLLASSKTRKTVRGEALQTEGEVSDFAYIILQGEFEAIKKHKTDIPFLADHERV